MKTAGVKFKRFLIFFILPCCFYGSCGLEEVTVVDEATVTYNYPSYSSDDYTTFYCEFLTNEENQLDSFKGTNIYYKIYNNTSTLVSERSSINNVNTSSNGSLSAKRMIEYEYQELGKYPTDGESYFIPSEGRNRRVYFRIYDCGDGDDLKADIKISGSSISRIPYRYSLDKSFDFFDNDDSDDSDKIDVEPANGDKDYEYSSTATYSDRYFVQFFAVGVSWDTSSTNSPQRSYSLVLDLGAIPVIKNK